MVQSIKEQNHLVIQAKERPIVSQMEMMKALTWLPVFEWRSSHELTYERGPGMCLLQWLENEKKEEETLEIMEAFLKIQKEMEAYLMDEEKLIYDPQWIFWESSGKVLKIGYVPWDGQAGLASSFFKQFAKLLWIAAVEQKWQNERLILMLYRMQIALKQNQNQPQFWMEWIEQEKRRLKELDTVKEQALDILTEEETKVSKRNWLRGLKEWFPIAIR